MAETSARSEESVSFASMRAIVGGCLLLGLFGAATAAAGRGEMRLIIGSAVAWLQWAAVAPLIVYGAARWPPGRRPHIWLAHLLAAGLFSVFHTGVGLLLADRPLAPIAFLPYLPTDLVIYVSFCSAMWALGAWRAAERNRVAHLAALREAAGMQIHAVRAHIPPALIDRSFQRLECLIARGRDEAAAFLLKLADFLRVALHGLSSRRWSVESELRLVRTYLRLVADREIPSTHVVSDPSASDLLVPAGSILHPLFEREEGLRCSVDVNVSRPTDQEVEIHVRATDGRHSYRVAVDEGPVFSKESDVRIAFPPLKLPLITLAFTFALAVVAQSFQFAARPGNTFTFSILLFLTLRTAFWFALVPVGLLAGRGLAPERRIERYVVIAPLIGITSELLYWTLLHAGGWFPSPYPLLSWPFFATSASRAILAAMFSFCLLFLGDWALQVRERAIGERRRLEAETELARAQLRMLQLQLQPHFLFNALNSLATLVRAGNPKALGMLQRLRRFYATVFSSSASPLIRIDEELRIIDQYIAIEEIRFGERLSVQREIDEKLIDRAIPALLLQPLVENAIKHGVARYSGPAWVKIQMELEQDTVHVRIANNVRNGAEARMKTGGLGLANVRSRLQMTFGSRSRIAAASGADSFLVDLFFPAVLPEAR